MNTRRVRRLHRHLRHQPRRRGRRDRADLLREPPGPDRAGRGREAEASTPRFDDLTEDEAERRAGAAQAQMGQRRGAGRRREAPGAGRRRLVDHFEERLAALDGKAMIVCMSRRICVALYDAIVEAAPGVAQRRRRRGRDQGRDDRRRLRPARLAAAHRQRPRRGASCSPSAPRTRTTRSSW